MTAHTLAEARARFTLVTGVGDGQKTACVASLLAWVDGCDTWTDAPECGSATGGMLNSRREYAGRVSGLAEIDLGLTEEEADELFYLFGEGETEDEARAETLRLLKEKIAEWRADA